MAKCRVIKRTCPSCGRVWVLDIKNINTREIEIRAQAGCPHFDECANRIFTEYGFRFESTDFDRMPWPTVAVH